MSNNEGVLAVTAEDDKEGAYLRSNGDFFINTFSELFQVYGESGTMNILSEEELMTLSVGMKETSEPGVMEVNSLKFEPNQSSPRNCFNTIF